MLVLVRARPVAPEARARSWSDPLTFAAAAVMLVAGVSLLLVGPPLLPGKPEGPCPARKSTARHAAGHELRVRAEPAAGGTTLVHLCADPALGPLRQWRVRGATGDLPIQQVSAHTALAAVATTRDNFVVTLIRENGGVLTFP